MATGNQKTPTIRAGRDVKFGDVSGQVAIGNNNVQYKDCTFILPDGSTVEAKSWRYTQGIRPSTDPNSIFGRQKELEQIDELLKNTHAIAIIGLQGAGKSTVASMYIDRMEERGKYAGIYWRKVDETMEISDVVGSFFTIIGKPIEKLSAYKPEDQLALLFQELEALPYIFVLDNFEILINSQSNKPLKPGFSELIEKANETNSESKFLFTCWECPECEPGIRPARYTIGGLDTQAAIKLLRKRGLTESDSELTKAVELSGGHPLALILLVQLIKEEAETLSEALSDDSLWKGEVAENVLDKVYKELSEEERKMLQYVAIYREPIPIKAVLVAANDPNWTEPKAKKVAFDLTKKSLLNKSGENYWEESLTRNYVLSKVEGGVCLHELACDYYLSLPLSEKPVKKEDVQPLIEAHYHACTAKKYDKAAEIVLGNNLDQVLDMWGNYGTLVELYLLLLPKDHFKDDPLLSEANIHGVILGNLGVAYRSLGDARTAIRYCKKALEIAQQFGDKKHEGVWLGNLGIAYDDLGEYKKAIDWYRKALVVAQKIEDKQEENRCIADLGVAYYNLGKCREAIDYYEKALKIAQQIGDRQHEGRWLGDLGCAYDDLHDYEKAIDYYEKALKIAQEIRDKRDEGTWLGHIGFANYSLGNYKKAVDYSGMALKIAQQIGDKQHEGTWLGNLGYIYNKMGDTGKAIDYNWMALKIAQQIGDKRNEGIWLNTLGEFFSVENRNREGLACYLLAKQIRAELGNAQEITEIESNLKRLEEKLGEKEFNRLQAEVEPKAEEILQKIMQETTQPAMNKLH